MMPMNAGCATFSQGRTAQDVTICISSEVAPEIREFERFSTVVANAYVRPLMAGYLHRLRDQLKDMGLKLPALPHDVGRRPHHA